MRRSKKVFVVGPAHPLRGGLATFDHRFAEALTEKGFEVVLYNYKLQYPSVFFPGKSQYTDAPAPDHLTIRTVINSINPLNWIAVGRRIRKERPEMLIFRYWMPFFAPCIGVISRIVRRNHHTKVLAIADNVIPHERRFFDSLFTRFFVRSMQGFVVMSEAVKLQLALFTTTKPVLFHPHPLYDSFGEALDMGEARKALGLELSGTYVLFFGFIRAYKGLDILLEAFSQPMMREQPITLLVVGEFYEEEEKYRAFVKAHGLADRILFVNEFVPNERVRYYFSAADVVVQPYKEATQSGVTQIAYHFNKPMIVTRVGALPEMVPDGEVGYVVEVDAREVAGAILRYVHHSDKHQFVENLQREKQRYSWDVFVERIMERWPLHD
ncbi:MAG: glycosyl transferase family 1 [Bacteroidetes bacterium]|nr:MAG: glycosyl transferase family 1 [Bacteroidota bacterium]